MKTHKHHIIPKHSGGDDHASNIVELSIKEHAEAHKLLYEQHGNEKDRLAWLGLSGLITKEEMVYAILTLPKSEAHKRKIGESHKGQPKPWLIGNTHASGNAGKPKSEEHKLNMSKSKQGVPRPDMIGNNYATAQKGIPKSKEHIDKIKVTLNNPENKKHRSDNIKASWENRDILQCPHCGIESKNAANMKRYHFDNCKKKVKENE
jgi:hypothetical protein